MSDEDAGFTPLDAVDDPTAMALRLARAGVRAPQIAAALRDLAGLSRAKSVDLMAKLAERLADAALSGQAEALDRARAIADGQLRSKGFGALTKWLEQHAGWSREGVDDRIRKAADEATRKDFDRFRMRAV